MSLFNYFCIAWVYFPFVISSIDGNDYVLDLRFKGKKGTLETSDLNNKTTYHIIDLSNNSLEFITPHFFETQSNLSELKIDGNPEFKNRKTEAFLHSKSLTVFSCNGCNFTEIYEQSFTGLPELKTLDLSNNHIKSIVKDAFQTLLKLEFVDLSGNQLDLLHFDTFVNNKHLITLNLSSNDHFNVTKGYPLIINTNLKILNVSGCNFNVIDDKAFSNLPNLREVYLQNNFIQKVSPDAFKINSLLANISFENNLLEQLPLSIITKETKNLCLDRNQFKLTRGYVRLYNKYEKAGLLRNNETTICVNRDETQSFEWLVIRYKLDVNKAGISEAFISTYILAILLVEIAILLLLICWFMKLKKNVPLDDLSQTILNENSIYKIFKND